jgi:hypothetical protein
MTPRAPASRSSRKTRSMALRSQTTTPSIPTSSRLEALPPELRHMIYSHLLIDHSEQKLQHPLMLVSKQTQADFTNTLAHLLGPGTQLTVGMTNNSVGFQLSYDITLDGVAGIHDIFTGNRSAPVHPFRTGWNMFRKSEIGRQMLQRTMRVVIHWPFLNTTIWVHFKRGGKPDVRLKSACRLARDARTRVTSREAESMLLETVGEWKEDEQGSSADRTDVYIKNLREKWQGLREEASTAAKRRAFVEAERRRFNRDLAKAKRGRSKNTHS